MDAKKYLVVDAIILIVYAVIANPALTGISTHEWMGIGLFLLFLVHTVQHYDWIEETLLPTHGQRSWQRTANLVLDAFILMAFMTCTVSGILISGTVLPAFGLYADGYYFWDPLHAASAKLLLALLIVHVVVHARMIAKLLRKERRGKMPRFCAMQAKVGGDSTSNRDSENEYLGDELE